ncbi:MAG: septum formation initiator family protein [Bacteroidales bacterium]
MAQNAPNIWKWLLARLKNKFFITGLIFILWMLIFDNSNWVSMIGTQRKINEMGKEQEYYRQKISDDKRKIKELRTNNENLEKFAREQYLMKKPNEDIFIFDEKDL